MIRPIALSLLLFAADALSRAHFIFVVPQRRWRQGQRLHRRNIVARLAGRCGIIADTIIAGNRPNLRDAAGGDQPLPLVKASGVFEVALNGKVNRVIHGIKDFGVNARVGKAHLLMYYPKSILGDAFDQKSVVGGGVPVEIVPTGKPGAVVLKLIARGKPVADGEITVILPGCTQIRVKTDTSGLSMPILQTGRIGAWARYWESTPGERDGKKYEEVRNYATLVFDAVRTAARLAALPEATSSMGTVESNGFLYVYGGHIAPTHNYFIEVVSGKFHRMNLSGEGKWEQLPSGPALQGMNIAAHAGKIYRIGGMAPVNKKGEKSDNRSTAGCARFDSATGKWEALPPLPAPRSSHDVVVVAIGSSS